MWFLALKPFIMPLILGGTLLSGGLYIKAKLADINTLKENNAKLLMVQEEQKLALEQKEAEVQQVLASYERQRNINTALEQNMLDLQEKFNKVKPDGSRRDLGKNLLRKMEWVEKIINTGTEKVFKCFESISKNEANNNCDGITTNP
jgi:hypothetical protein